MIPDSEALEPCPFCGVDDAKLVDATRILGSWKVVHRCKTVGYLCVEVSDRDRAISDWNRRASHLTRQEDETRRAALEEADGWQPIETAPMSFTPVLGLINGSASVIAKSKDNRWCEVRHLETYDGVGTRFPLAANAQPSHWMPFPIRTACALKEAGHGL